MEQLHQVPEKLKEKLKAEYGALLQLRAEMERLDSAIQNVIGAYILGAGIPANNVRFDENYDILYDDGLGEPDPVVEESGTPDDELPQMTAQRGEALLNATKKPKVR